jgi:hypothetical protein
MWVREFSQVLLVKHFTRPLQEQLWDTSVTQGPKLVRQWNQNIASASMTEDRLARRLNE